jgi:hypothetical protein
MKEITRIIDPVTGTFDLVTKVYDSKTKRVIGTNNYRLRCYGQPAVDLYERPVGSGNLYYRSGEPAGQFDYETFDKLTADKSKNATSEAIKIGMEHAPWEAPETADEKMAREFAASKKRNEQLEKELAAIKAEQKPVVTAATKPTQVKQESVR